MKFRLITVAESGCGIVAAHNALCVLNIPSKFSEVTYFLDERSYLHGKYGAGIYSIWEYLKVLKSNGCKPLYFWGVAGKLGRW